MASSVVDKLNTFFATFPLRTYPKGQILVFANEAPSHTFYVVSGRVRKYDISYRGDEVIVNVFQNPAILPMAWVINRTHNSYFYAAETVARVRVAPPDAVFRFVENNPDIMLHLLSQVYQNNEGLLGRIVQLMAGTARSRLVYELVIEAQRFGQKLPNGNHILDVTEADLAARSGMSRETVSREFSKLAKESLVHGGREGIIIHDLGLLHAKLD